MMLPPRDVPAFAFWLMPDEDPLYEEWPTGNLIRSWQRGRCAMCGFGDRLVMDHDRATGLVRGELCRGCNASEGFGNDSAQMQAWRAGFTPAAMLGVEIEYVHPVHHRSRALAERTTFDPMDPIFDEIAAAMI